MKYYGMPHFQMRRFELLRLLKKNDPTGKSVLEIGYGAGEIISSYIELGMNITGFDDSDIAYQYAEKAFGDHSQVRLVRTEEQIEGEQFDFVIACEVLEHIENDSIALKKWVNYLKPGGTLILSVPLHQNRWGQNDTNMGHFCRYEKGEVRLLFESAGLSFEEFVCYDFPSCFILEPIRNMRVTYVTDKYLNPNESGKDEATKLSGVARDESKFVHFISNPILIYPIILFQQLFRRTEWGSGGLFLGRKPSHEG